MISLPNLAHGSDHNRPTAYEVAVTVNGATTVVGYTARKTKASLLATAMDQDAVREKLLEALPADDDSVPSYDRKWGWSLGPTIRIHFTGGTDKHPTCP